MANRVGRIPDLVKAQIDDDLSLKVLTLEQIAAQHNVSMSWLKKYKLDYIERMQRQRLHNEKYGFDATGKDLIPDPIVGPPKVYEDLCDEAKRALDDIEYFALRYYGMTLQPWQRLAVRRIVELYETPFKEYLVINVAPGCGKTELLTRVLPAWLTCRNRRMRGMIGSATSKLAANAVALLSDDLVRDSVDSELSLEDEFYGLSLPESTMALDFGRFVMPGQWQRNAGEIQVALPGDRMSNKKEKTWTAFGRDMNFLGWRVNISIWDDLQLKGQSADNREKMFAWWDSTVETRLERQGLICLVGQRLDPNDIYRYALDKPAETEIVKMAEMLAGVEHVGDPEREGKKYHHIVFKAYDETKDTGDPKLLMGAKAKPWPEGPLLAPDRITWPEIKTLRLEDEDNFQLVYQQNDHDLDRVLVKPQWVSGGVGPDGEVFVGCRDEDRAMWEVPAGLSEPVVSIAMTDPSHTKYWASHWYLWQPALEEGELDLRHVMAASIRKMDAPEFLDFNMATGTYSGLMEEWYQTSKELGRPIQHWIVEQNGAQRYLLKFEHVRRWMQTRGVHIHGHTTGRLKTDPDLGVQSLGPVYRRGLIRLPMADTKRQGGGRDETMNEVIKQVTTYPDSSTDDAVMSQWFFEANADKFRPMRRPAESLNRPAFLRAFGRNAA